MLYTNRGASSAFLCEAKIHLGMVVAQLLVYFVLPVILICTKNCRKPQRPDNYCNCLQAAIKMAAARAEAQRQAQLQAAQQQNRQNFLAGELITSYWLSPTPTV